MRGSNDVEKRDEIGSMFEKCKLDILGLTKLRGEGELIFRGVRGIKSGVRRRVNAREGVAILMREIRRINSRIMYVEICIKREFLTAIVEYAKGMERSEEERDGFCEELKGFVEVYEDLEMWYLGLHEFAELEFNYRSVFYVILLT